MRSADYPYPPDEFDAAAGTGGPRGVHRAPRSAWSRWWPFLVALLVVPAIAVAAVLYVSENGLPWAKDGAAASSSSSSAAGGGDEESPSQDPSSSASSTPAEQSPSPSESATSAAPTPPAADLARAVLVENATGKSGLAGGARDRLTAAGYTAVTTGNWKGATLATSTVYYPKDADLGTATAVAQQLGIATVKLDAAAAGDQVRVVLEADYKP